MRESVSIRNISTSARHAAARLGKSEASRASDLTRLLPLWPRELADRSVAGRKTLIGAIARALRQERIRGRQGHWAYDVARHAALYRILHEERAGLASLERTAGVERSGD
jgi:hypothetical protein